MEDYGDDEIIHEDVENYHNTLQESQKSNIVKDGAADFTDIFGILKFIYGIANGTHLSTTPNMTKCQNGFLNAYKAILDTYNAV